MSVRARRVLAVAVAGLLIGCAKKAPPSGGPPDLDPPRVIATVPDSGAAGVARDAVVSVTFSEGMEPRSTIEAVELTPPVEVRHRRWGGRTLTLVLADSLRANATYTLSITSSARDRHGNGMTSGRAVAFTTADSFPPGRLAGAIDARGFEPEGTALWTYVEGHTPDSTARDYDALGVASRDGGFAIVGLPVPGRYRLWAFADFNRNRSFEPDRDVLAAIDTTFELTRERPLVDELLLRVTNPRAPGQLKGIVIDSTGAGDTLGVMRLFAQSQDDTTRRITALIGDNEEFTLSLQAGRWWLVAFRDHDRNGVWRWDVEPGSEVQSLDVAPAAEIRLTLYLRRNLGAPPPWAE